MSDTPDTTDPMTIAKIAGMMGMSPAAVSKALQSQPAYVDPATVDMSKLFTPANMPTTPFEADVEE
jgi:hypothetical protein